MNDLVNTIAEAAIGALTLLIGVVWADNKRRVSKVERLVEEKADISEFNRQRDHIEKLFENQTDIRQDMNGGFQRITDLLHNGQLAIMQELAKKADR